MRNNIAKFNIGDKVSPDQDYALAKSHWIGEVIANDSATIVHGEHYPYRVRYLGYTISCKENEIVSATQTPRVGLVSYDVSQEQINNIKAAFYDIIKPKKCECGAHKCKDSGHARWCDMWQGG